MTDMIDPQWDMDIILPVHSTQDMVHSLLLQAHQESHPIRICLIRTHQVQAQVQHQEVHSGCTARRSTRINRSFLPVIFIPVILMRGILLQVGCSLRPHLHRHYLHRRDIILMDIMDTAVIVIDTNMVMDDIPISPLRLLLLPVRNIILGMRRRRGVYHHHHRRVMDIRATRRKHRHMPTNRYRLAARRAQVRNRGSGGLVVGFMGIGNATGIGIGNATGIEIGTGGMEEIGKEERKGDIIGLRRRGRYIENSELKENVNANGNGNGKEKERGKERWVWAHLVLHLVFHPRRIRMDTIDHIIHIMGTHMVIRIPPIRTLTLIHTLTSHIPILTITITTLTSLVSRPPFRERARQPCLSSHIPAPPSHPSNTVNQARDTIITPTYITTIIILIKLSLLVLFTSLLALVHQEWAHHHLRLMILSWKGSNTNVIKLKLLRCGGIMNVIERR
jgi:hypothetical protein